MPRDSLPAAAEVFAGLPQPLPDDDRVREAIRAMRAADGLLLGVLGSFADYAECGIMSIFRRDLGEITA